jgi:hypothetical protein
MTERAEAQTFRLSRRLSVEITAGLGGMCCEWLPRKPEVLTDAELAAYRSARAEMLQRLAASIGCAVLCVEV